MKMAWGADPAAQKLAAGVSATAAGAASSLAMFQDWALQLFGVPLPVLLAAVAGAFLALTFASPGQPARIFAGFIGWSFIGTFGADLVRSAISSWISRDLPIGAIAGCAALLALGGSLFLTVDTVTKARAAIGRWLDGLWTNLRGGGDGS